ncbi:hypothetical protein AA313_de0209176 [Arthrobotrys entomopaga]|nr:hypothetical protein AA313_de0209176 [Arthrobotrys entomopaga]
MQLTAAFTLFVAAASATVLKWDNNYSPTANNQLTIFACSDGPNGIITKQHVSTVPQLVAKLKPGVTIGAVQTVAGWNSQNCGKCYNARNPRNNKSQLFVAIDVGKDGAIFGPAQFSAISDTGNTDEGSFVVYLSEQPDSSCYA